jgi:hypothetical protein
MSTARPFRVGGQTYANRAELRAEKARLKNPVASGKRGAKKLAQIQRYEYKRRQKIGLAKNPDATRRQLAGHGSKLERASHDETSLTGGLKSESIWYTSPLKLTELQYESAKKAFAKAAKPPLSRCWLQVGGKVEIESPPGSGHQTKFVSLMAMDSDSAIIALKHMSLQDMLAFSFFGQKPLGSYFSKITTFGITYTVEDPPHV